jgi:hypothetical protein
MKAARNSARVLPVYTTRPNNERKFVRAALQSDGVSTELTYIIPV